MSLKKAIGAAAGCVAMQIPYASSVQDPEEIGAVGMILNTAMPIEADMDFDGYSDHWWWDNLAHFLGGYAVGYVLAHALGSRERVLKGFLVVTGAWEIFEYHTNERPWHTDENGNMEWEFDHAMEDTALDTVAGAAGAYAAASEVHGYDIL